MTKLQLRVISNLKKAATLLETALTLVSKDLFSNVESTRKTKKIVRKKSIRKDKA